MDPGRMERVGACEWRMEPRGAMRVPAAVFADERLLGQMDEAVLEQLANVASLPGAVEAVYAMPDAHWGYGFPIGGVAAFDPDAGGVVSAGGVGFDISCGVRTLHTGLRAGELDGAALARLADALARDLPAGVGARGPFRLGPRDLEAMLEGGARWAVERGHGRPEDLERTEHGGTIPGAWPGAVSALARSRQAEEMGTLGSGNHYAELQVVEEVFDAGRAAAYGLRAGELVLSLHCGSRGLGHQVATDYTRSMVAAAQRHGIRLPDRQLACAPVRSPEGEAYLGAMRAAANCALANRQMLAHFARESFRRAAPRADLRMLYDVSHNFCGEEEHDVAGRRRRLFVHRKGATAARGPGDPALGAAVRPAGQPVLVGGSMGADSYVLAGVAPPPGGAARAFASALHGAGRAMSRHEATRRWNGCAVVAELERRGILVRCRSARGVAEEAPGAYKDPAAVVDAAVRAGLAARVARLAPRACVKG